MKKGMETPRRIETDLRQWLRTHDSIIGSGEARALGASWRRIEGKVNRGEWDRPFRGVYRDTSVPRTALQTLRAAVVATGGKGIVSHASAAWLWDLLPAPPDEPDLSIPRQSGAGRRRDGMTIHRCRDLDLSLVVTCRRLPVTNPLRTLIDLAASAPPQTLTAALDAALASKLVTMPGVEAEVARLSRSGRPGVGVMREELARRGYVGAPPPSVLEAKLHRLIASIQRPGMILPSVEVVAGDDGEYRLDVAWAPILLAVEADGYVWHFSPEQLAVDHDRRNRLQRAGWTVLVYTWRDVVGQPGRLRREIGDAYDRCQEKGGGPIIRGGGNNRRT